MKFRSLSDSNENTMRVGAKKRALALVLCAGMIVPMAAACKKKNKGSGSDDKNAKGQAEYVDENDLYYSDTSIDLNIDFQADPTREVARTDL